MIEPTLATCLLFAWYTGQSSLNAHVMSSTIYRRNDLIVCPRLVICCVHCFMCECDAVYFCWVSVSPVNRMIDEVCSTYHVLLVCLTAHARMLCAVDYDAKS